MPMMSSHVVSKPSSYLKAEALPKIDFQPSSIAMLGQGAIDMKQLQQVGDE